MLIEAARRVETAAKEVLAAVEAGSMSGGEARQVLAVCTPAMAALTAAQTAAARVVAGAEQHGDGGAQVLADTAGLPRHEARSQVKTARTIESAPAVRDAVEAGRVPQANARRLAEAIEKTGAEAVGSDAELLSKAVSMRPEQFTKEARRWTADRQRDGGESDYRRLRARRRVRVWDGDDGMVHVHGEFDPVAGNRIGNRLRAVAGRLRDTDKKQAGADTERRSFDQCMADALDSLTFDTAARGHHEGGSDRCSDNRPGIEAGQDPKNRSGAATGNGSSGDRRPFADICVVAHVDSHTGKLVAELPDGTRLPTAVLEELACNARLTGVVFDRKGKPIWRAESCRTATEAQRRILIARYGGCFHCKAHPALCQIHHIRPVSQGGSTRLDNMVPVCWECHQKIHHHKWQIQTINGVHTLHPPGWMHHGPAHVPEQPPPQLPCTDPPLDLWSDTGELCAAP